MPLASYGIAPVSLTTRDIFSGGTKRNSGLLSTNFLISQGQAILSTFAFSRVTHFIHLTPVDVLHGRKSTHMRLTHQLWLWRMSYYRSFNGCPLRNNLLSLVEGIKILGPE